MLVCCFGAGSKILPLFLLAEIETYTDNSIFGLPELVNQTRQADKSLCPAAAFRIFSSTIILLYAYSEYISSALIAWDQDLQIRNDDDGLKPLNFIFCFYLKAYLSNLPLYYCDPLLAENSSMLTSERARAVNEEQYTSQLESDTKIPANTGIKSLVFACVLFVAIALSVSYHLINNSSNYERESWVRSLQKHGEYVFSEHKALRPLDSSDYAGVICAVLGLMIAAGGGIGGGGILVPIFILVMGFSPKHAIPLSNVTVFGGAVANAVLNANKRHPLTDRPLVDWDLILVMEPLTIAGALIGAFLNKILPSELLVVMLVLLLAFTAYTSLAQAVKMYRAETRHLRALAAESELTKIVHEEEDADQEEALLEHMELQEGENPGDGTLTDINFKVEGELAQILEEERKTPMSNVYMLVSMFIVVLFINVMKGGGAFRSPLGIRCGSNSFWVANAVMLGWILVTSFFARNILVQRFETKRRVGYQYVEGDIQWDGRATIVYPAVCCFAGFFAGMFDEEQRNME